MPKFLNFFRIIIVMDAVAYLAWTKRLRSEIEEKIEKQ